MERTRDWLARLAGWLASLFFTFFLFKKKTNYWHKSTLRNVLLVNRMLYKEKTKGFLLKQ